MRLSRGALVVPAALLLVALLLPTTSATPSPDPETGEPPAGRVVLLLDSSGSMKEPATGGNTKIDAARTALDEVVDQMPGTAEVGIRVFGAKVENRTQPGACTDTQNVVPVGPLDREKLKAAVADYTPYGETPIGNALKGAAEDLGAAEAGTERTIVLLSDGEPTCAPDPCTVARQLRTSGIDLRINVVGLDVSGKARRVLQCVARAGGGRYTDATDTDDLTAGLVKTSVRALRHFQLTGTPVTGGTTTEQATPLEPGTYTDTSLGEDHPRYYLLDKPRGGSVAVSALLRPTKSEKAWSTVARLRLLTPDGDLCNAEGGSDLQTLGHTPIIAAGVEYGPLVAAAAGDADDDPCLQAEQLLASVEFDVPNAAVQLGVTSYPAIENVADLPAPLGDEAVPTTAITRIPAGGPAQPIAGGVSFADAAELSPGTTYADTIRPGEQLTYKVKLDYGQAASFAARLSSEPQADQLLDGLGKHVQLTTFSPLSQQYRSPRDAEAIERYGFYLGKEPLALADVTDQVRARNLETYPQRALAHDGFYYYVIGMGADQSEEDNFTAPLVLRAEVSGEVSGAPKYDGDVEGGSQDEEATDTEADTKADTKAGAGTERKPGGVPWLPIGFGAGAVAVLGLIGSAYAFGRRRGGAG